MRHILAIVDNLNNRENLFEELFFNRRRIDQFFVAVVRQTVEFECPHLPDEGFLSEETSACVLDQEGQIDETDGGGG